jgi:hypothetical protein
MEGVGKMKNVKRKMGEGNRESKRSEVPQSGKGEGKIKS